MKTLSPAFFIAITTVVVGCAQPPPSVGDDVAAVRKCPPDGCDPSDPSDPPPPPPPKPPQPDPAKYRTAYLPDAYIRGSLVDYLSGTKLQITHTTGDPLAIPSKVRTCKTNGTSADQQACIDDCNNDSMLTPAQKAQCRANCTTQTCTEACGAYYVYSYLRWGGTALAASVLDSPRKCTSATCRFCATPTDVPSLDNIPLDIPAFSQSYNLGVTSVDISCKLNHWTFAVLDNIAVTSKPDALYLAIPGATGSPAIQCSNAPDATVDGFGLQLKLVFPPWQYPIEAEASLLGDWHVFGSPIDYVADLSGRISGAVTSGTTNYLNSPDTQKALWNAFSSMTEKYVNANTHETFDRFGYAESQTGRLKVTYWVK